MSITLEWYNDEKTILLETFAGKWTLAEYRQMIDEAAEHLASVKHTVHIIVDASASAALPGQMTTGMRYAIQKIPRNQGLTVFVDPDVFTRMLLNVASKISVKVAQATYIATSIEEALEILKRETSQHH